MDITLTTNQKKRLAPFIATCLTFAILYMPLFGYPPETLGAAFFKVLPILSLCMYVFTETHELNKVFKVDSWLALGDRDKGFVLGLFCSSLGDICLVWRTMLFVPGLLCFACAHVFYLNALRVEDYKSKTKSLFVLLGIDVFLFIQSGISSYVLTALVGIYVVLIFTMGWKATARYEAEGSKAAMAGCVGACLFIVSDLLIAVDKWLFSIPMAWMFIMTTYYSAQLGIALSVTQELN